MSKNEYFNLFYLEILVILEKMKYSEFDNMVDDLFKTITDRIKNIDLIG